MDDVNIFDIDIGYDNMDVGQVPAGVPSFLGALFQHAFSMDYNDNGAAEENVIDLVNQVTYEETNCSCVVKDHLSKRDDIKRIN